MYIILHCKSTAVLFESFFFDSDVGTGTTTLIPETYHTIKIALSRQETPSLACLGIFSSQWTDLWLIMNNVHNFRIKVLRVNVSVGSVVYFLLYLS